MAEPRIAPIGDLDAALNRYLAELAAAEEAQIDIVAKHADAIAEVEAARRRRADAFYAADRTEKAIRKLGYVVLGSGGKDVSLLDGHGGNFSEPVAPKEADQ